MGKHKLKKRFSIAKRALREIVNERVDLPNGYKIPSPAAFKAAKALAKIEGIDKRK